MITRTILAITAVFSLATQIPAASVKPPKGFIALFDGKTLDGWWGATTEDPRKYLSMTPEEFARKREASLPDIRQHWTAQKGELVNDGKGLYLTTDGSYRDYELLIDYKTVPLADSGIYLKGTPQIQIWDYTETKKFPLGADLGSGGLWNNSTNNPGKNPLVLADRKFGEWNKFRIIQVGARTSVYLNNHLVVSHATLENFFDRKPASPAGQIPIPVAGPIQLQTHGGEIRWRNIYLRELPAAEANALLNYMNEDGFQSVFNGRDFTGWAGPVDNYEVVEGAIVCKPKQGGTIYTKETYADFVVRLEFKLPPGGNNGLAIRYPGEGNPAYAGMCEVQVLDDNYEKVRGKIDPRQAHGSAYGMVAAHRGYQRPVGEWNFQEVTVHGSRIKVELNGFVIMDTDLGKVSEFMANSKHPGKDLRNGHFGFAGHSDPVAFRNIRIKRL